MGSAAVVCVDGRALNPQLGWGEVSRPMPFWKLLCATPGSDVADELSDWYACLR